MQPMKRKENCSLNVKSLSIGRLSLKNNIFIAPLAGYTDYSFRKMCYSLGAGLCFTEMVSAKGLFYNSENTASLLHTTDSEYVKAVQLFGNDPDILLSAATSGYLEKFDIIDLNCGCPVPKVYNNGEGSALLNAPETAEKIISNLKKSGKVITLKMREGIKVGEPKYLEFAKRMEGAGVDLITFHARFREQYYSGEPDYAACAELKHAVKVPIIFNGGVFSKEDFDNAIDKTGADGVMLARGVMQKPWLISEILGEDVPNKKQLIRTQINDLLEKYDEIYVARFFRKQFAFYLKNVKNSKRYKELIFSATTTKTYFDVLNEVEII